ncbi:MAG TPA: response regulator [Ktedonobacteraceae bacterium]|nr:response regulator [Ktedonobacteraceae bacterium]
MEALPDHQSKPLVLIVEDNAALRQVVRWSLAFSDYQPVEAADGLEALQWMELAAQKQHFASVILLHLAMPRIDGHVFLFWLQSSWLNRYPAPAVVIMTAERFDTGALSLPPCVKHIGAKPFHVSDLLRVIRKWSA